ncbi:hypothetical protein SERLA73DRAFT_62260 [Serpula lacrymans var. lacrymans S7.3]|uniref:Uncharacterized protein n=1 Tax=Serpula lacrymans var. lacrymans (strain S7.3) TaxID=936435 RepID=F8QB34_SERL3|nr:hypothetical protein SERLA73DRAFT_62260 [Serpula lacrymans var. lacrymans S7.3]
MSLSLIGTVTAIPLNVLHLKRNVNPALVPPFGWQSGIDPDGTGNCAGAVNGTNGQPIQIPCQCPPNSTFFLASLNKNVAAGFVVNNPTVKLTFPTDNSTASQNARLNAAAVTLQNLEGPGVGCPIAATTFFAQQKAIDAETPSSVLPQETSTVPSTPTAVLNPVPTNVNANNGTSGAGQPTDAQITALAPPLGWPSGINPDGTGNCDGAVNDTSGKPILIPCQCPPDQTNYISNLTANIRAGYAVLNPTVHLTFPTDNSTASQSARLTAASITLQNLNGPGKGCPIVATTFAAQQQAVNAETSG